MVPSKIEGEERQGTFNGISVLIIVFRVHFWFDKRRLGGHSKIRPAPINVGGAEIHFHAWVPWFPWSDPWGKSMSKL